MRLTPIILICLFLSSNGLKGQTHPALQPTEHLLKCISVEKGEVPNWDFFKQQFTEDAVIQLPAMANRPLASLSVERFIETMGKNYSKTGFSETAQDYRLQESGNWALVFQRYKAAWDKEVRYGMNIYQLILLNGDWKVRHMTWLEGKDVNAFEEWFVKQP